MFVKCKAELEWTSRSQRQGEKQQLDNLNCIIFGSTGEWNTAWLQVKLEEARKNRRHHVLNGSKWGLHDLRLSASLQLLLYLQLLLLNYMVDCINWFGNLLWQYRVARKQSANRASCGLETTLFLMNQYKTEAVSVCSFCVLLQLLQICKKKKKRKKTTQNESMAEVQSLF